MKTWMTAAAATAACLGLAGCGGGSGDAPAPPPPPPPPVVTAVPDSAIASPTALVSYLGAQAAADETSEALTLPAGEAATSETDEPLSVAP
ncbi:hypothetical protein [Pelomonas cellulosilytica]|uniref:Uncharacterized protein n=1 Tax=Pelomonas cellulosilytica TaxID=2906762 RepID=A0ABS8XWY7_9BURK|nr:hypothetical protein [Pelomonas sp. P8]MCE4556220.1 hypothetical protein [Pelomonas sp. P8]